MSRSPLFVSVVALLLAATALNCGDARQALPDTSQDAGNITDSGTSTDAGPTDAGVDAGPSDAGVDAGPMDAGPVDAGWDPGPVDGGGAGACNNASDLAVFQASGTAASIQMCAQNNLNTSTLMLKEPQTLQCIENLGLSMACSVCIDDNAQCTIANCLLACIGGESAGCRSCRATNCDPALLACAGVTP